MAAFASDATATVTAVSIDSPSALTNVGPAPTTATVTFTFDVSHCDPYAATITVDGFSGPLAEQSFAYPEADLPNCPGTNTKTETVAIPAGTPFGFYDVTVLVEEFGVGGGYSDSATLQEVIWVVQPSPPPASSSLPSGSTAPPTQGCPQRIGRLGRRLVAALKCFGVGAYRVGSCAVGIGSSLLLPLKALKLVKGAKAISVIAKLPKKFRPAGKFIYRIYHTKYNRRAPYGYQNAQQVFKTFKRAKTAINFVRVLPQLANSISAADLQNLALATADLAGLKPCVQLVADIKS